MKRLHDSTKEILNKEISKVFERLKIRLLSPMYRPSDKFKEQLKHDKVLSMPGLYLSAYQDASAETRPSMSALEGLVRAAENYLNVQEQKAKDKAIASVEQALNNAQTKENYNYQVELNQALLNAFDQVQGSTKQVLQTELQRAKTIGLQEGTLDLMERYGIDDPTVAFLTRKDNFVCKWCKEFYNLPDGTPRTYKLSELKSGYFNPKDPQPHLAPLHPNCFLTDSGNVLTDKGWKPLKYVAIGDQVWTHKQQFKKVINTMNWDMTVYRKDFYSFKPNQNAKPTYVTPDHQLWTQRGFVAAKDFDPNTDLMAKLVQNCTYCNKNMDLQGPKLFCGNICRDNFFSRAPENVHKLERIQTQMEYYKADKLFWYHKSGEPTFLHDITVEEDESLNIDGVFTKNCRCLYDGNLPVVTDTGKKALKNLEVGDKVLTHTGKFKRVLATFGKKGKDLRKRENLYRVEYINPFGKLTVLRMTPDHLMQTQRGWVRADELTPQDSLSYLFYPCLHCGVDVPYHPKYINRKFCGQSCASKYHGDMKSEKSRKEKQKTFYCKYCQKDFTVDMFYKDKRGRYRYRKKQIEFCSIPCSSHFNANNQWRDPEHRKNIIEKNSISMKKQYEDGTRSPTGVAIARRALFNAGGKASSEQLKLYNFVKNIYSDAQLDYEIGQFYGDIAIPSQKVVIEWDGGGHYLDVHFGKLTMEEKIAKDKSRDEKIESLGWHVLRYNYKDLSINKAMERSVDDISRLGKNSNSLYKFKFIPIKNIAIVDCNKINRKIARLYDIQVEDDASFVINGVVSHNCLMISIYPGYGFENGILQYIGPDHDEYEAQKNVVKKSLNHEEFAKHDCAEHRHK